MTSSTKFKVGDRVWVAVDVKNGQGYVNREEISDEIAKARKQGYEEGRGYNWQCHTPRNVKEQLENSLLEIDKLLAELAHKQKQKIDLPPKAQP